MMTSACCSAFSAEGDEARVARAAARHPYPARLEHRPVAPVHLRQVSLRKRFRIVGTFRHGVEVSVERWMKFSEFATNLEISLAAPPFKGHSPHALRRHQSDRCLAHDRFRPAERDASDQAPLRVDDCTCATAAVNAAYTAMVTDSSDRVAIVTPSGKNADLEVADMVSGHDDRGAWFRARIVKDAGSRM